MTETVMLGIGIGCIVLSGIMGLLQATVHIDIESAVNGTRPPEQQVWWGWGLTPRNPHLHTTEYRRLYPNGPLIRRLTTVIVAQGAFFATGLLFLLPWWLGPPLAFVALAFVAMGVLIYRRR